MECFNLTPFELDVKQAEGWILRGGPFSSQDECLSNCGPDPKLWYCMNISSSASASSSKGCVLCTHCGVMPRQWTVTSSGWDDNSDSCLAEFFNGTFTLDYIGLDGNGNCIWEIQIGSGAGTTTIIRLVYANQWQLEFSFASSCDDARLYSLGLGNFECCASNTMPDVTDHVPPTGVTVPATVLLEPVGDCSQCACCEGLVPTTLNLNILDFENCDCLAGDYTLEFSLTNPFSCFAPSWIWTGTICGCDNSFICLSCEDGGWFLLILPGLCSPIDSGFTINIAVSSCEPFMATGIGACGASPPCLCVSSEITATITG